MPDRYIALKLAPIIKQLMSFQTTPSIGTTVPFDSYGTCISVKCNTEGILGDGYCVECWDGGKGRRSRNWDTPRKKESRVLKIRENIINTSREGVNPLYGEVVEEMLDKLEDFISEHGPKNKESLNQFICDIGLDKYVEWKQIENFISNLL